VSKPKAISEQLDVAVTKIASLTPHPRNYRGHPDDQIEHLMRSIQDYGFYRNVVACTDGTILAGHGIVIAAERLGMTEVPVVFLMLDPNEPRALKVLALDNYASHLAEDDDRMLTDMLREIQQADDLMGTGFDEISLAALMMITRTAAEVRDFDAAAEWVGLPEYVDRNTRNWRAIIEFDDEAQRERFLELVDLVVVQGTSDGMTRSYRWDEIPGSARRTPISTLRFGVEDDDSDDAAVSDLHTVEGSG